MEPLRSKPIKMGVQGLCVLFIVALGSGCVPLMKQPSNTPPETAQQLPPGKEQLPPANLYLETMWQSKVLLAEDTESGGREMPGLAARVYIFGPDRGKPVLRDGELFVKLFDLTNRDDPKLLEIWQIDPISLRRLAKEDVLGPGYTIFLPWGKYSPSIPRINMQVTFTPTGKQPIMHQSGVIGIDHSVVQSRELERQKERQPR